MYKVGERTYLLGETETQDLPLGAISIRLKPCFPLFAFGYGWHSSTKAFINLLEHTDLAGKTVLDLGSGNGILSILAMKLGASKAVAVDLSWQATKFCTEHAILNSVQVEILEKEIEALDSTEYDLVLGNLSLKPNEPQKALQLDRFSKPGGNLFFLYDIDETWRLEKAHKKHGNQLVSKESVGGKWRLYHMKKDF